MFLHKTLSSLWTFDNVTMGLLASFTATISSLVEVVLFVCDAAMNNFSNGNLSIARRKLIMSTILMVWTVCVCGVIMAKLESWTIAKGFIYAIETLLTIGYGNAYPSTNAGRIFLYVSFLLSMGTFGLFYNAVNESLEVGAKRNAKVMARIKNSKLSARIKGSVDGLRSNVYHMSSHLLQRYHTDVPSHPHFRASSGPYLRRGSLGTPAAPGLRLDRRHHTDFPVARAAETMSEVRVESTRGESVQPEVTIRVLDEGLGEGPHEHSVAARLRASPVPMDAEDEETPTARAPSLIKRALTGVGKKNLEKLQASSRLCMVVVMAFGWWLISAFLFTLTEPRWTYSDAVYFSFATITTIGYGDIVPSNAWSWELWLIYVFTGIGIFAFFVSTLVETYGRRFKGMGDRVKKRIEVRAAIGEMGKGSAKKRKWKRGFAKGQEARSVGLVGGTRTREEEGASRVEDGQTTVMTLSEETFNLRYLTPTNAPVANLECKAHFDALTDKEKFYVHYISRVSWEGYPVMAAQMSPESLTLVKMLRDLFVEAGSQPPRLRNLETLKKSSGVSDEAWKYFIEYSVEVLYNASNYKSFGDTKFVPRCSEADFEAVVNAAGDVNAKSSFANLKAHIYALAPTPALMIGYPDAGHTSGFYSKDVTKEDIEFVQKFLSSKNISPLNTFLHKSPTGFFVMVASSTISKEDHTFEGRTITVFRGNFNGSMQRVATNVRAAIPYAANENQAKMLEHYARSFETGDMEEHKESQKWWIKDVGPTVETNFGFVETYKDPAALRAEWEGFVAVVNKEMTAKFEKLVDGAADFIKRLPWGPEYEKDKFNRPDFTSLEVITYCTGGHPPLGINIPNYDDIRMNWGFKNVSLGNMVNVKVSNDIIPFVTKEDMALLQRFTGPSFEVKTGLHELLGHGSGKLLTEEPEGTFNFDKANPPMNPLTGKPADTWYGPGETWGSKFGAVASSYEECRAEVVALVLAVERDILKIFGAEGETAEELMHAVYLDMARAGFAALEVYDPETKKWGQAHSQARFGILKELLASGAASVTKTANGDNAVVQIDQSKILSHAHPAMKQFLLKLHVYKSTGDAATGAKWYVDATSVPDEWVEYRDIVMRNKRPRKIFVQGNTFVENGAVVFKEYPATLEGFLHSFVERDIAF
ncbi:bifunctional diacylglycerol diphosphate phosphatase/phosphatidate phosphatase [Phlyctochytrium bullatum]|nr:bifunctional diacylglycerol diphosphate phosphatase/phosphatidate phosphatase [Phlyctochytrium bullatum]